MRYIIGCNTRVCTESNTRCITRCITHWCQRESVYGEQHEMHHAMCNESPYGRSNQMRHRKPRQMHGQMHGVEHTVVLSLIFCIKHIGMMGSPIPRLPSTHFINPISSERVPLILVAKLRPATDMPRPGGSWNGITSAAVPALSKSVLLRPWETAVKSNRQPSRKK